MLRKAFQFLLLALLLACLLLFPPAVQGQISHNISSTLTVIVRGPGGDPIDQIALVELSSFTGQYHQQASTRAGRAEFTLLGEGAFTVTVVLAGFQVATEPVQLIGGESNTMTIMLQRASDNSAAAVEPGPPILAPRAKKELGKAGEALRAGHLPEAHAHLEVAYKLAPANPDVNYIFGLYCARVEDWAGAKSHLEKVLKVYPKYIGAMLSLGTLLSRENKTAEAVSYYKNAVEAEPSSWRAHALLADALLQRGSLDEAVAEAERAAELGPGQAPIVQPLLARALAARGDKQRAELVLQNHLRSHPADTAATEQLAALQAPSQATPAGAAAASVQPGSALPISPAAARLAFLPPPSVWFPPDVDENIPPVEPIASCPLDHVLQSAAKRVQEFVSDVDRFTATEFITHQTINKWGLASTPEKFKFDYLVSIQEVAPKLFNVEEYRPRAYSSTKFPDGVQRTGLPTLMLIFHPYNSANFEMTCEGLSQWNGKSAWQVHFRQRSDRPNTIREYRLGGMGYPAALKGRAWIAADTFQIVRLETDLVAPMPQIRLVADHASVEYGPVNFRARNVDLWLPQHAEFYYDWLGHRGHRVHRFQNYLLFSVTDWEHISSPKVDAPSSAIRPGSVGAPQFAQ